MNGKKRYIPIVALGALLIALLAILPVAAAGEVSFIDPDDINDDNTGALTDTRPDEQEWSGEGGQVGIHLDDSDLNVAVKRVLIPNIDTKKAGEADIVANSNVITIADEHREDLDTTTTGDQTVERNDLIMVGYETLRKVTKVEFVDSNDRKTKDDLSDDDVKLTLDRAYHSTAAGSRRDIHWVKRTYVTSTDDDYDAFDGDGYKTLASGLEFGATGDGLSEVSRAFPGQINAAHTDVVLDRYIVDSGIGSHVDIVTGGQGPRHTAAFITPNDKGLAIRLRSAPSRGVRNDDVLMLRVSSTGSPPIYDITSDFYPPLGVDADGEFRLNFDHTTGHADAYVLFWAAEQNETSVTVRSGADTTRRTLVLRETAEQSGKFAAKISLAPKEAAVLWDDIPTQDADGDPVVAGTTVVDLENDDRYEGYPVVVPEDRPTETADVTVSATFVTDFNRLIPTLRVNDKTDRVAVRHPDDTKEITIESVESRFSNFSPGHESTTQDTRPELAVSVTDANSGLAESGIRIIYTVDDSASKTLEPDDTGNVDEINNGFEVSVRARLTNDEINAVGDREIKWWVKATDKAGNVTYSDRLPFVDNVEDSCTATTDAELVDEDSKCQPHIVTVDDTDPVMESAETGRFWDPSLSTGKSDDKTEYRTKEASRTSVLVVFSEHLDRASVQASDFEVNDATPQRADAYNVKVRNDVFETYAVTGNTPPGSTLRTADDPSSADGNKAVNGDNVENVGEDRGYVFLTVREMTTNAKPKVELVGSIEDEAGNRENTGTVEEATDRIGPTLTVAFSEGARPVARESVTLTVTADEDVDIGTTDVSYYRVKSTTSEERGSESVQILTDALTNAAVEEISNREYRIKITPPDDGLYTVYVQAEDSADTNLGTIGDQEAPIDVDSDTKAVLFELDTSLPKPDFDPGTPGVQDKFETDDAKGFLRIDYSAEAKEYYATTRDNPRVCNEQVETANCDDTDIDSVTDGDQPPDTTKVKADDLDTYGRVTLVSATLDGEDVSDDLHLNTAGNVFQFHLEGKGLEVDKEHDFKIVVRDQAGNQNVAAHEATIKIIERKKYKLELNPGWNLVSLPGQPTDPDINAVIPADHPIDAVSTYDPTVPGQWLTALESGDGTFVSEESCTVCVRTIEAGLAYWIRTTSFQELEVDIPKITPGAAVTPPTIPITQGWNLIPILDVDGDFELADQTTNDNYFDGLTTGTVTAIYTYDTITNSWASVDAFDDDLTDDTPKGVQLGKGYWVYATKPGVIVP